MKTTVQILHDEGLFDKYANADEVLKNLLLIKVNERRRLVFEPNKRHCQSMHSYRNTNYKIGQYQMGKSNQSATMLRYF